MSQENVTVNWERPWDEWHNATNLHENKLVCFGLHAGFLAENGYIRIPSGLSGEDAVASLGIAMVKAYEAAGDDIYGPFDLFCEAVLRIYFPVEKEP